VKRLRHNPPLWCGVLGVLLLSAGSVFGPLVLSELPPGDPVRAALLPPGAAVVLISLTDGQTIAAHHVDTFEQVVRAAGPGFELEIPVAEIVDRRRHRFWLGSDRFGRDLLRLILAGGRISLAIALTAGCVALLVGGFVGLASATAGRLVDAVLMRVVDALLAFPVLFLMILVATVFRAGPGVLVLVLGLTSWMGLARLIRGQVLALRRQPFVMAAQVAGSRWHRVWGLHYAPNIAGPVSQDTALRLGDLVIAEATLSYLGLGVPPSLPTWGSLVAEGHRVMLDGWWLATFPGIAIVILVVSLALIGDGIQKELA
jgi:peptide/nickel transport system permease protein